MTMLPDPHAGDPDWRIRMAAFAQLTVLIARHGPVLPWQIIETGFAVDGQHFLFANKSKGIFRPAGMRGGALSIKTIVPRQGKVGRYVSA